MGFRGLIFALVAVAGTAQAQDSQAIEGVIGGQLQAFNDKDVAAAWEFASPTIKRLFGSSDNFGAMVQQGYPMVWDNNDAQFLSLEDRAGVAVQRVLIRDGSGLPHILEYMMIETADGWRIAGVSLLPAPDVGA